jgi:uncharacterized membrane protein
VTPIGVAAGALVALFASWGTAALTGWVVLAGTLVAWSWFAIGALDANDTKAVATIEDEHRLATELLLLSACVVSLVGTGIDFMKAGNSQGGAKAALVVLGVATVGASWALVHTIFTVRYAHLYYTSPVGGIDFKNRSEPPAYPDFAYVAFTVGMTFQVSDTDIQSTVIRRAVLRHSLLSYLFGAVILASMVNIVADIVR